MSLARKLQVAGPHSGIFVLLPAIALCAGGSPASAAELCWTGKVSLEFTNAANWTPKGTNCTNVGLNPPEAVAPPGTNDVAELGCCVLGPIQVTAPAGTSGVAVGAIRTRVNGLTLVGDPLILDGVDDGSGSPLYVDTFNAHVTIHNDLVLTLDASEPGPGVIQTGTSVGPFTLILNGAISGSSNVQLELRPLIANTIVLGGANTYAGGTLIAGGTNSATVRVAGNSALGTGEVSFNRGTLLLAASTLTNAIQVGAGAVFIKGVVPAPGEEPGETTLSGPLSGGTSSAVNFGDNNSTCSGGTPCPRVILSGDNSGYLGSFSAFQSLVLNVRHANALGSASPGTTLNLGATLEIEGGVSIDEPLGLTVNGAATVRNISGANVLGGNASGGPFLNAEVLGGTLAVNGTWSANVTADVQTGATLLVNGTLGSNGATTPCTVASGATLGGSGRINGTLDVQGALVPGSSPGTLQVAGSVTFGSTGSYVAEIDGASTDLLEVLGSATVARTVTLDGTLSLTTTSPNPTAHVLLSTGINVSLSGTFSGLAEGAGIGGGVLSYQGGDGNDVVLTIPACGGDPCTTPPGECYQAQGTCNLTTNACQYAPKPSGNACSSDTNPCTADVCDGQGTCSHPAGNAGAVCRPSAGACDEEETCDGISPSCPEDGFLSAGTVCRASSGSCDPAESCSGATPHCPIDAKSSSVCRPATGECDVAESCDGISNNCPADILKSAGETCSSDANPCTLDVCDGQQAQCTHPAGNAGSVCRVAVGPCDAPESCDGVTASCPSDGYVAAGVTCRPAAGACDAAEACSGASPDCPVDAKSLGICRPAAGECDVAESCDGVSNDCPADQLRLAGDSCSADANPCTLDVCDGQQVQCTHPAGNAGALCRPAVGACDEPESCDGSSTSCPADGFTTAGTICRASGGACDLAESCTGDSRYCPIDAKSSSVCRPASGQCDVAESCDGVSDDCPPNRHQPQGTGCDDGDSCTSSDACDGSGACGGTSFSCPPPTACQLSVACNGSGGCIVVNKEPGTPCSDGGESGICDDSGVCVVNQPPSANAGSDQSITYTSNPPAVQLDGCSSTDDGRPSQMLTFFWEQIAGNSVVIVSDATVCNPTFTAPDLIAATSDVLSFQLTVSDGELTASDTVDITVANTNRAPHCEAIGPLSVGEQTTGVQLLGDSSFDPDDDPLSFSWQVSGPQPILLSDPTGASPTFDAPELSGATGGDTSVFEEYVFTLTVSDGELISTCETTVRVENVNHPPTASAVTPLAVNEGDSVTLDASASNDPDNDALSYAWTQSDGPLVVLQGGDTATPGFVAPDVGSGGAVLTFEVAVSDSFGGSDLASVTVQVSNIGDAPDCSSATLSTETLWPPNHKLVEVEVINVGTGGSATTVTVDGVSQDEPMGGLGDGDTGPDAIVLGSSALLRAERSGSGDGRVYRVTFTATNGAGSCTGTAVACVPQSMKGGGGCVAGEPLHDSTIP